MSASALASDRMLPERFDLTFTASGEVVVDVEALARGVLGVEGWPSFLEPADEWELRATLLSDAVLLERQYRRREGIEARPWLFERLRFKARDWRRVKLRHPLAADLASQGSSFDSDGVEFSESGRNRRSGLGDGSHGAPGEIAGDRGDPGSDALLGLLEGGDRAVLREIEALGLGPPPGARARDPETRKVFDRLDRARRRRVFELEHRERRVVAA